MKLVTNKLLSGAGLDLGALCPAALESVSGSLGLSPDSTETGPCEGRFINLIRYSPNVDLKNI